MIDNSLRELLKKDFKMGRFRIGFLDLLLLFGMTLMGICIRFSCKDVESMDYTVCLKPWVDEFKAAGSFRAVSGDFYNYTPPYMYVIYFISLLKTEPLYPIKIVSGIFDFIMAVVAAGIVHNIAPEHREKTYLTYGIVFCLPTVAVNSGLWGQCDVIYVTFLLLSLFLLYAEKPNGSMLCFAMAFTLKLQALFVFPLYVFLWVKKKYKIGQFLYLPLVYILWCIPAVLAGKSFKELLLIYVLQGNTEPWMLSWNWPNIYLLFGPDVFWGEYSKAGILATLMILMLSLFYMIKFFENRKIEKELILRIMLMFSLLVPFFLPYMHERYGYLADILAVILAMLRPEKFYIAFFEILLSYTAYTGYLHGASAIPQAFYCFVMTGLVAAVCVQVFVPAWESILFRRSR